MPAVDLSGNGPSATQSNATTQTHAARSASLLVEQKITNLLLAEAAHVDSRDIDAIRTDPELVGS